MKILNLKQFRELPPGTPFMKYIPCVFDELMIKGETWEYDFIINPITHNVKATSSDEEHSILDDGENNSNYAIPLEFDCTQRDGCFDENQLFAVYEQKDLDGLIERLKQCKGI